MRQAHYLKPLRTTRIPHTHIAFDCETKAEKRYGKHVHKWVCGAGSYGRLDKDGFWGRDGAHAFTTPQELWEWVVDHRSDNSELCVWAHNLAFDLRISEALRILPELDYNLSGIVLEKTAAWAAFTSKVGKLTICDLHSWLPVSLNRVAESLGHGREKIHYATADVRDLELHCKRDVEITADAVGVIVEYLAQNRGGSFRPTGSGQSHSMWRRRWLEPRTVLVHGDEVALERERTAMWAGRTEAWRWGEVKGPLYEWDFNLAYCRIAAGNDVPVKLAYRTGSTSVEAYRQAVMTKAVLAEVTVEVDSPIVPTAVDGRIFWPVGRFRTCLWEPELQAVLEHGYNVEIHRTWQYRKAPVLSEMASYLIEKLHADEKYADRVLNLMFKHWARTLVGRCALRYRQWDDYGTVPVMGLSLSTMFDDESGDVTELLQVGRKLMELSGLTESDSSVPQITGWVTSRARVNLWRTMLVAGLDTVAYVDTDSLIVDGYGNRQLTATETVSGDAWLIPKSVYSAAEIRGPRNLILEGERRISGVPVTAVRTGDRSFSGEVWSSIRASLEHKHPNEVEISPRDYEVEDKDTRREHIANGQTQPFEVNDDAAV